MQLPLRIGLRDSATLANFYPGDNAVLIHTLQQVAEPFIYVWGGAGSGKSHLLQALCHAETTAAYLPLGELRELGPAVLDGLEAMSLVCVDDLQAVAADPGWETALFHLYNRVRGGGGGRRAGRGRCRRHHVLGQGRRGAALYERHRAKEQRNQ